MKTRNVSAFRVWIIAGIFLLVSAGLCFAQPPAKTKTVKTKAQARLMARRAAIEDGYRQIAEIVYGIRLDSHTTVRDFITQNDQIRSRVRGIIRHARIVDTEYLPDGVCKVKMELRIRDLHRALRRKFAYCSDRIRVIGFGAPNPVEEPTPVPPPPEEEEEWEELIISATGSGVPPEDKKGTPQGRLLAERAAYLDALRNLAENIKGVHIDSRTTVRDFITQKDVIQSQFETWIKGAKKTMVRELPDGTVEVDVEMPLKGLRRIIRPERKPHRI
ncbi:LPP20 family lipoprotein [Candidatus Sumerlaeota bacterium]|nr:LPP20 family lipoprotein [Candidatus Sumerlaeota bacterium]